MYNVIYNNIHMIYVLSIADSLSLSLYIYIHTHTHLYDTCIYMPILLYMADLIYSTAETNTTLWGNSTLIKKKKKKQGWFQ